ncbi:membrane protein [Planotetraspora thailandica]|uniref:Membrane protein n=1 Tax=Planotetraspora thailandica TaxID=487172 RepID=A0A8J3XXB6_9ACTN|nr:EamA family transporter [Planotetraspora thailandica]GII52743.1 membrane protein [Planotetraspora thailandica]
MFGSLALAAVAALGWGVSDFVAGLWSRRLPVVTVLGWSKVAGMAAAVAVAVVVVGRGEDVPRDGRLWWAVVAGLTSVPAMGLLYLALRKGTMSVVAPVAATSAAVPLLWGVAHGERFSAGDVVGMAAVLTGVTLVSWPRRSRRHAVARPMTASLYAFGAALGFGAFYVMLHQASTVDPGWSAVIVRMVAGVVGAGLLVVFAVGRYVARRRAAAPDPGVATPVHPGLPVHPALNVRPGPEPARRGITAAVVAVAGVGLADASADGAFAFASTLGSLGSAAVLSSLYPAVTVVLSVWLLRERIAGVHAWGVMVALFGGAFLAAG